MSGTTYSTLAAGKQAQILNDFMTLFRGNERGYGVGEFKDAKQRDTDNKWTPGHVRWTWGKPEAEQYRAHLSGELLTGIGVLCDDGCVWFTCLDVDDYDIDYSEVMGKVKRTELPLCVFRTKSGGLRVALFFCEVIEAEIVIPRMQRLAATLGYSKCEVFPKQSKLDVKQGDCPSWIFLPYNGTRDIFADAGLMNDLGNLLEIGEAMTYCTGRRIDKSQFLNLFAAEDKAKSNGKSNGNKHPKGSWVEEDGKDKTVDTMFWGGPPCLWTIVHTRYQHYQNNFLLNCATFLKKKYPENWDKALEWINFNVLLPVGDQGKLEEVIKSAKGHDYNFKCNDEPIVSFCFSDACRRQPFGVGEQHGIENIELGMTIVNRIPRQFWVNVGDQRISFNADELLTQQRYKVKCLEHGVPFPNSMKKEEWENLIRRATENATVVEPSHIMRTNANELEILSEWFARHVPISIRQPWNDKTDSLRVKEAEKRIYFKWEKLAEWMRRSFKESDVKAMRVFLESNGEEHKGGGHWWRYTISASFGLFDMEIVDQWLGNTEGGENGRES